MIESLTGKWLGIYIYGAGYEDELRGKTVPFEIEFWEEDSLVKGTCIDEETRHLFKTPSLIAGTFENGTLIFYKTYPSLYDIDANGEAYIIDDAKPPSIQYTGWVKRKCFSKKLYFQGNWEIHGSFMDEEKRAQYYELEGTWKMKKI